MRALFPALLVLTSATLLSTGCSKSAPDAQPDGASASQVVLGVPGMS